MNNSRCIVTGIFAVKNRVKNHGFAQIAFVIATLDTLINRIFQTAAGNMDILPQFNKKNSCTGILAEGDIIFPGIFNVLKNLRENILSEFRFFLLAASGNAVFRIFRQVIGRF